MKISRTFARSGKTWTARTESFAQGVIGTTTLRDGLGSAVTLYLHDSGAVDLFAHQDGTCVLVGLIPAGALEQVVADLHTVTGTWEDAQSASWEDADNSEPYASDVAWLMAQTYTDHVGYVSDAYPY